MLRILGFLTRLGLLGIILLLGAVYVLLASAGVVIPGIQKFAWLLAFILITSILLKHRMR